jgi:hypothetical protein
MKTVIGRHNAKTKKTLSVSVSPMDGLTAPTAALRRAGLASGILLEPLWKKIEIAGLFDMIALFQSTAASSRQPARCRRTGAIQIG